MNENKNVTLECAKTLKELGFDYRVVKYYVEDKLVGRVSRVLYHTDIPAPTLHEAADWFREKHGIYICPGVNAFRMWFANVIDLRTMDDLLFDGGMYKSYWNALSHGIDEAIKIIGERANR